MAQLETQDVWPEVLRLKDELTLRELAARVSSTPGAVSAALKRAGVRRSPVLGGDASGADASPASRAPASGSGPAERDLLPEVRRALQNIRPGSKDTLIAEHAEALGRVPDAEVARRAGVSVRTVASFRARHDIPGYRGPRRRGGAGGQRRSRIDPYAELLGKVPDRVVAEKAGVSLNAVRNYRVKRGIPAAGREAGQSASRAVFAAGGEQEAWKVTWEAGGKRVQGVVLAHDLSHAVALAGEADKGRVVGLELAGPVLT